MENRGERLCESLKCYLKLLRDLQRIFHMWAGIRHLTKRREIVVKPAVYPHIKEITINEVINQTKVGEFLFFSLHVTLVFLNERMETSKDTRGLTMNRRHRRLR